MADLVITPEMIQAGIEEAWEHTLGEPLEDLVRKVFTAMSLAAPTADAYWAQPATGSHLLVGMIIPPGMGI